jgi:hypothetical protein
MGRLAVLILVALSLTLTACTPERAAVPMPVPSQSPSASASAAPDDSASGQQPLFDLTNNDTITRLGGTPKGRDFIDGLVAAGFDKSVMQLTPDKTAIGLDADNIQFSVQIGEECLVGQFGNVGYDSAVLPVVANVGCLIGKTRAIDW